MQPREDHRVNTEPVSRIEAVRHLWDRTQCASHGVRNHKAFRTFCRLAVTTLVTKNMIAVTAITMTTDASS